MGLSWFCGSVLVINWRRKWQSYKVNSGHVLRVLSLKFPKDSSARAPGRQAEVCAPLAVVLMFSHVSRPPVCQSQLFLAHREFCQLGVNPLVHETGHAGVFTPRKLANDVATDQSWFSFLESRGLGRGLHTLSACPCCVATCLLFLKRSSVFKRVCCIFASRYDTFLLLPILFGSLPSWLCHFL